MILRTYRPDWVITSCATNRKAGKPMSKKMRDLLSDIGIDGSQHRSRALSEEILADADVVFGFQPSHIDAVTQLGYTATPIVQIANSRYADWHKVPDPAFDSTGNTHKQVVRFLIDTLERFAYA